MHLYNLGRVRQIVNEGLGLDVSHAYEDIVFVEHSPVIIKFNPDPEVFDCFFNKDCSVADRDVLGERLNESAVKNNMKYNYAGTFTMNQVEGKEEIKIIFNNA